MRMRPERPSASAAFASGFSPTSLAGGGLELTVPTFFINGERLDGRWSQLARIVPAKLKARAG